MDGATDVGLSYMFSGRVKNNLKAICYWRYLDNCPPRKFAARLGLGFESRLGLVLGLGGNQTVAPVKNCHPVRVRVSVRVSFGVGGQFSSRSIVLEPLLTNVIKSKTEISAFLLSRDNIVKLLQVFYFKMLSRNVKHITAIFLRSKFNFIRNVYWLIFCQVSTFKPLSSKLLLFWTMQGLNVSWNCFKSPVWPFSPYAKFRLCKFLASALWLLKFSTSFSHFLFFFLSFFYWPKRDYVNNKYILKSLQFIETYFRVIKTLSLKSLNRYDRVAFFVPLTSDVKYWVTDT